MASSAVSHEQTIDYEKLFAEHLEALYMIAPSTSTLSNSIDIHNIKLTLTSSKSVNDEYALLIHQKVYLSQNKLQG